MIYMFGSPDDQVFFPSGIVVMSYISHFSPFSIPPTLLVNSLITVHTTLLSSSIPQATPSSFNMLAELEAIWHKRDDAVQQNEAPVAGSVEGQSLPVKIETLLGKVVQLKLCNRTGGNSPGKSE